MNSKYALLVTGGKVEEKFLKFNIDEKQYDLIVCVDGALEVLDKIGIRPNYIVGDFDTVNSGILEKHSKDENIKLIRYNAVKDDTDTQAAIKLLCSLNVEKVDMIGALGSRLDHTMANIYSLYYFLKKDVNAFIINSNNRIRLIDKDIILEKCELYSKYISLVPFMGKATVTLKGFCYELEDYTFDKDSELFFGVSNEIKENSDKVVISVKNGMLILLETKD